MHGGAGETCNRCVASLTSMVRPLDPTASGLTPAQVREIPVGRPFHWLALGLRDLARAPWPSLFHGLVVAAGGWVIFAITAKVWYLLPGAFSGFVLVGPILATGLYELSRRLAAGESAKGDAARAWSRGTRPLGGWGCCSRWRPRDGSWCRRC
jgi:uncharacterized membrane protein